LAAHKLITASRLVGPSFGCRPVCAGFRVPPRFDLAGGTFTGDVLAATTAGTNTSTSYDSSNERLVLSGSDKVTFAARENPNNFGSNPTRTVTWLLDDGSGSSATSTVATTTVSITNAERKIRGFGGSSSAAPASRARLVNGRTTSVIANMVLAGLATVQAICKRVPVPSQLFLPTHNQRCMRPPI
jgi:hypothetical protein